MQPVYPEDEIEDPRQLPAAYDTSGVPVNPPPSGFQLLGEVQGTSTSNAYLAEQEAQRRQAMSAKERAEAEQAAIRFAGQQKFRSLIAGGAKPEEAMRLAGPEMFWNNPAALVSSVRATREATPFKPDVVSVGDTRFAVTGPNRAEVLKPEKVIPPKMPQANTDQRKILDAEMRSLNAQLTDLQTKAGDKAERVLNPNIDKQIADLSAKLSAAKNQFLNLGTNWTAGPVNPSARVLTKELAADFKRQAKGDNDLARKLAREAGYTF